MPANLDAGIGGVTESVETTLQRLRNAEITGEQAYARIIAWYRSQGKTLGQAQLGARAVLKDPQLNPEHQMNWDSIEAGLGPIAEEPPVAVAPAPAAPLPPPAPPAAPVAVAPAPTAPLPPPPPGGGPGSGGGGDYPGGPPVYGQPPPDQNIVDFLNEQSASAGGRQNAFQAGLYQTPGYGGMSNLFRNIMENRFDPLNALYALQQSARPFGQDTGQTWQSFLEGKPSQLTGGGYQSLFAQIIAALKGGSELEQSERLGKLEGDLPSIMAQMNRAQSSPYFGNTAANAAGRQLAVLQQQDPQNWVRRVLEGTAGMRGL